MASSRSCPVADLGDRSTEFDDTDAPCERSAQPLRHSEQRPTTSPPGCRRNLVDELLGVYSLVRHGNSRPPLNVGILTRREYSSDVTGSPRTQDDAIASQDRLGTLACLHDFRLR